MAGKGKGAGMKTKQELLSKRVGEYSQVRRLAAYAQLGRMPVSEEDLRRALGLGRKEKEVSEVLKTNGGCEGTGRKMFGF